MNVIEIVKSIVLGIIQGITEWLPISTGHLILFDNIWPMASSPEFFEVFKVVIQFGSILAVLVLFFHKLNPFSPRRAEGKWDTYNLWKGHCRMHTDHHRGTSAGYGTGRLSFRCLCHSGNFDLVRDCLYCH